MTPGGEPDLRFLFDQHLNLPALHQLKLRGIDVVQVAEVGLSEAADADVLQWARRQGRIVVTKNYRDFAPLIRALARRGEASPGLLFFARSVRQSDAGANVRALETWIHRARARGENPARISFDWLR